MFEKESEAFGPFEKISLMDQENGNGFSLVPKVGGTLLEIWLNGQQVLDGVENAVELQNNLAHKSSLLFPFPNRLNEGKYQWLDNNYQFPINDAATKNALHGFGREVEMEVLRTEVETDRAMITLSYFYEGEEKAYPFPFLLEVRYKISIVDGFEIEMKLTNEANVQIPIGLGWHPYFKLEQAINQLELQVNSCSSIEVDERMIPTGAQVPYAYFNTSRPIGAVRLDNAFLLNSKPGIQSVFLSGSEHTLEYWQETGPGKFNYLQMYTPEARTSIAIEPMTCNIDAFNNRDGLLTLAPEEFITVRSGLKLSSKK